MLRSRVGFILLLDLCVGCLAGAASAEPAASGRRGEGAAALGERGEVRRVLVFTDGGRAKALRAELVEALPDAVTSVPSDPRALLARARAETLGAALASPARRGRLLAAVEGALTAANADAAILAHPRPGRSPGARVEILIVARGEDEPSVDEVVILPPGRGAEGRAQRLREALARWLAPEGPKASAEPTANDAPNAAGGARAAPPASKTPIVPAEAEAGPAALKPETRPPWLTIGADLAWGYRMWRHKEPVSGWTRSFDAYGVPGLVLHVEGYPFASSKSSLVRNVGFAVSLLAAPYFTATGPDQDLSSGTSSKRVSHASDWYALDLGLRARTRAGTATFGAELSYNLFLYDFDVAEQADREIPRARYQSLRLGLDARVPLGRFAAELGAAYRHVFSVGSISTYGPAGSPLPLAEALGTDVRAAVSWAFTPQWELRLGGEYVGVFYDADTTPTPTGHPGSVIDQYWVATLGAAVAL